MRARKDRAVTHVRQAIKACPCRNEGSRGAILRVYVSRAAHNKAALRKKQTKTKQKDTLIRPLITSILSINKRFSRDFGASSSAACRIVGAPLLIGKSRVSPTPDSFESVALNGQTNGVVSTEYTRAGSCNKRRP